MMKGEHSGGERSSVRRVPLPATTQNLRALPDGVLGEGFAASRVLTSPDAASLHSNIKSSHRRSREVPSTLKSGGLQGEVGAAGA